MKKYVIILVVFLSSATYSQEIKIGFKTGLGVYNMEDLKDLTSEIYSSLPFEAKVVSNYPSFIYYKPGLYRSLNKFNLGVQVSFNSTGSRISSKDYSGEYKFDTKINGIAPSVYVDYTLYSFSEKFMIQLTFEGGIIFSEISFAEDLFINDQQILNKSYSYKVQNYFFEPGFKIDYQLYEFFSIGLTGNYLSQFGNNVFESDDNGNLYHGENILGPDWSGLRIGLSIMFSVPTKLN